MRASAHAQGLVRPYAVCVERELEGGGDKRVGAVDAATAPVEIKSFSRLLCADR